MWCTARDSSRQASDATALFSLGSCLIPKYRGKMTKSNSSAAKRCPKVATVAAMVIVAVYVTGCAGVGPKTIPRDRFEYVAAISESWKRQTLLNLVKTRYVDAPVFMDVASVINQYSLEGEIELGLEWEKTTTKTLSGLGRYADRPTITYSPLLGERFARSFLTPIPIPGILLLMQAGYPADYVLRICAQAVSGIENGYRSGLMARDADPEFYDLLSLFHDLQLRDGIGMRKKLVNDKERVVMFFRPKGNEAERVKIERLMKLLGLKTDVLEFTVVFGRFPTEDTQIAILSRSILQIMVEYASYIDVPESDVAEGRACANRQESPESRFPPLIKVHNSPSRPQHAHVAVPYRERWFWIDDRDTYSKSTFYFLMILFSFTERGESEQRGPVLTVPTN